VVSISRRQIEVHICEWRPQCPCIAAVHGILLLFRWFLNPELIRSVYAIFLSYKYYILRDNIFYANFTL